MSIYGLRGSRVRCSFCSLWSGTEGCNRPQLFPIMINDLPKVMLSLDMMLYADDSKGVDKASCLNDCQKYQAELE